MLRLTKSRQSETELYEPAGGKGKGFLNIYREQLSLIKRLSSPPTEKVERISQILLWMAIATYTLYFLRLTFGLYDRLAETAYDLGIFDQAAWLISRSHPAFVTVRGLHLLADHFSVILYLVAPLYWLWDSPKMLLAVQTIALALGALPIYALTRRRLGSAPIALLLAVAYLLYPAMEWTNTFDFHPETLGTPMLLAAFYYLSTRSWRWYFIMITLFALTKETAGLTIVLLGCYALLGKQWRIGWLSIGFGAVSLAVALATIRYFNNGDPSPYWSLYAPYGHNPSSLILNLVHHPNDIMNRLSADESQRYIIQLMQPLVFLPLLAPEVFVIAVPSLLANMLSSRGQMQQIYYQYTAFITPILFGAAIVGMDRWKRWGNGLTTILLLLFLSTAVINAVSWGPLRISHWPLSRPTSISIADEAFHILQEIPPNASVSAQASLVPHIAHRVQIYTFPNPFCPVGWGNSVQALNQELGEDYPNWSPAQVEKAISASNIEYVALCPPTTPFPLPPYYYSMFTNAMIQNLSYGIVAIGRNTVLLHRGADHRKGLHLLEEISGVKITNGQDAVEAFVKWAGGVH